MRFPFKVCQAAGLAALALLLALAPAAGAQAPRRPPPGPRPSDRELTSLQIGLINIGARRRWLESQPRSLEILRQLYAIRQEQSRQFELLRLLLLRRGGGGYGGGYGGGSDIDLRLYGRIGGSSSESWEYEGEYAAPLPAMPYSSPGGGFAAPAPAPDYCPDCPPAGPARYQGLPGSGRAPPPASERYYPPPGAAPGAGGGPPLAGGSPGGYIQYSVTRPVRLYQGR